MSSKRLRHAYFAQIFFVNHSESFKLLNIYYSDNNLTNDNIINTLSDTLKQEKQNEIVLIIVNENGHYSL